jgi:Xaa-Pro aminopeptidase
VLRAGMVVTVEPAVATADGIFHHEHDVLVTEDAPEVISEAPVELFEVR